MKKLILLFLILPSCSLNSDSAYWNQNLYSEYEVLEYDKDYTFKEYGKMLNRYNDKSEMPNLN